jgi:3-phenylpropionate/trans-cinnamate dioxygenase ferredoxin reductase component
MPDYQYLIVGGGMTAAAAVKAIGEADSAGSIGLIGNEEDKPYKRPPLTKQLWKGKPLDSIWLGADEAQARLHLGRIVKTLDLANKKVTDDQGTVYGYEKLLLATGGTPRRFPFGGDDILYYRYLSDYRHLRELADKQQHFTVIGSGFIGSEIAAALAMNGKQVTMIYLENMIGERLYPADLAEYVTDYYRQKGVQLYPGEEIAGLSKSGDQFTVRTKSGKSVTSDAVIAGLGILPNVDLAEAAGLRVDNGIIVDEYLRTSTPDVYAAGDVASFFNPALNRRMRVEHEDNANMMGKMAGQNMAGQATRYDYLPYYYSDLFELGYEAIGELDSRHEIVPDWEKLYEKGVIYYLKEGRIRGVLLWNVWDQVPAARKLIADEGPFNADNVIGAIPMG